MIEHLVTQEQFKKLQARFPKPKKRLPSPGEELLAQHLAAYQIPFKREQRFHPARQWRFDFTLDGAKIAVEVEGGVWSKGRHNRPSGFIKDMEKYNAAAGMGWQVLRFTTQQVKQGAAIDAIRRVLGKP